MTIKEQTELKKLRNEVKDLRSEVEILKSRDPEMIERVAMESMMRYLDNEIEFSMVDGEIQEVQS